MFREELISAHYQKEAEAVAKTEREVRKYIGRVFGPKWARLADIGGHNVKIEDIKLFIGSDVGLSCRSNPAGNSLLVFGRCPHCGIECWSQACFSAAAVGEQLVGFQASWRHNCTGLRRLLHHLRLHRTG